VRKNKKAHCTSVVRFSYGFSFLLQSFKPLRILFIAFMLGNAGLVAQDVCTVKTPTASMSKVLEYPALKTEVRAFWTDDHLYFLFTCPYKTLNIFLPAQNDKARTGLWDRDVVEIFLGADWEDIGRYREFEIAPTGDWIDLAIHLELKTHRSEGHSDWRSGWQTSARIDKSRNTWYAAARIPLKAVTDQTVADGTRWRANLYRIDGQGADPQRQFLCWQPTCAPGLDPNHVPENFGTLTFSK
jgi:hypothetical protein